MVNLVPSERIESLIFLLRGQKVMLSTYLAELYEVEPRILVQAVKRNIERFPPDFMFQLNKAEFKNLKSQIVTSSPGRLPVADLKCQFGTSNRFLMSQIGTSIFGRGELHA